MLTFEHSDLFTCQVILNVKALKQPSLIHFLGLEATHIFLELIQATRQFANPEI